eukprot:6922402-Prymnesium_polylepis.1
MQEVQVRCRCAVARPARACFTACRCPSGPSTVICVICEVRIRVVLQLYMYGFLLPPRAGVDLKSEVLRALAVREWPRNLSHYPGLPHRVCP